jgi:hypothetical protein
MVQGINIEDGVRPETVIKTRYTLKVIGISVLMSFGLLLDYMLYFEPIHKTFVNDAKCYFRTYSKYPSEYDEVKMIQVSLIGCNTTSTNCHRDYEETDSYCFYNKYLTKSGVQYMPCQYYTNNFPNSLYICPCHNQYCLFGRLGMATGFLIVFILIFILTMIVLWCNVYHQK